MPEEYLRGGDFLFDWAFSQKGVVSDGVDFDPSKKEMVHDVSNQRNHAHI